MRASESEVRRVSSPALRDFALDADCAARRGRDVRARTIALAHAAGHRGRFRGVDPKGSERPLSDAERRRIKAGYFRYTNEDEDGAISYANLHWNSGDPQHPSQLWYDVNGNLLGADFSVLQSASPSPPKIWGVNYRRWVSFREHIHYILTGPNGTEIYGATSAKKFAAAGGNVDDPQAATLVTMGKAKSADKSNASSSSLPSGI